MSEVHTLDIYPESAKMRGMIPSAQLIIVETLFASSKRSSYVLVLSKEVAGAVQTPEQEAVAFSLGLGHTQTPADAAAIFVLSRHDDSEAAFHSIRDGVLLEAEDVMKRPPDEETATMQVWLVAEING